MKEVLSFEKLLHSILEKKPHASSSIINSLTEIVLKHPKLAKHFAASIAKFLEKSAVEYKLSGLYVIDSVCRAAHKKKIKDVIPFFEEKLCTSAPYIKHISEKDKEKVERLIGLWKKGTLFKADTTLKELERRLRPKKEANVSSKDPRRRSKEPEEELPTSAATPSPAVPANTTVDLLGSLASLTQNNTNIDLSSLLGNLNTQQPLPTGTPDLSSLLSLLPQQILQQNQFRQLSPQQTFSPVKHPSVTNPLDFDYGVEDGSSNNSRPQAAEPTASISEGTRSKRKSRWDSTEEKTTGGITMADGGAGFIHPSRLGLVNANAATTYQPPPKQYQSPPLQYQPPPQQYQPPPYPTDITHTDFNPSVNQQPASPGGRYLGLQKQLSPPRSNKPPTHYPTRSAEPEKQILGLNTVAAIVDDGPPYCMKAYKDPQIPEGFVKVIGRTLYVGGIAETINCENLRKAFESAGRVDTVVINYDKCNAFIKMFTRQEAEAAQSQLNGQLLEGSTLRIRWGCGFGPKSKDVFDFERGISLINVNTLNHADISWMEKSSRGGGPAGMNVMEEPNVGFGSTTDKATGTPQPIIKARGGARGGALGSYRGSTRPSRNYVPPNLLPYNPQLSPNTPTMRSNNLNAQMHQMMELNSQMSPEQQKLMMDNVMKMMEQSSSSSLPSLVPPPHMHSIPESGGYDFASMYGYPDTTTGVKRKVNELGGEQDKKFKRN